MTCITPEVPVSLSASVTGGTTADLSWSPGSPAGSATVTYAWQVRNTSDSVVASGSTTSTSTSVTGLSEGTTYTFTVQATTSCDNTSSAESDNNVWLQRAVEGPVPVPTLGLWGLLMLILLLMALAGRVRLADRVI